MDFKLGDILARPVDAKMSHVIVDPNSMKRLLFAMVVLGLVAVAVGCDDKSKNTGGNKNLPTGDAPVKGGSLPAPPPATPNPVPDK